MNYILLFLLVFASNAFAGDKWTQTNTNLEIAFQALNYIDYRQTTYIAEHPESYYEDESAWAIGKHPSVKTVETFMLVSAVGHYAISRYLITEDNFGSNYKAWRSVFQYITIGDKLNETINNYQIGITFPFK